MISRVSSQKIVTRLIICLFWLFVIWLALIMPSFVNKLFYKKSISILAWPTILSPTFLKEFEAETGIKVNITYFENNEELFVKMKSGAAQGYDLIMPADYVVSLLTKYNLLKPIDKKRLLFWPLINQHVLGHHFDRNNEFTLPYSWAIYGIAYNAAKITVAVELKSWSIIFDNVKGKNKIGMIDDAREVISIAAWHFFRKQPHLLTKVEWKKLSDILRAQKAHVAMYTDMRADYLLSAGICALVVTNSSDIGKLVAEQQDQFKFFVPHEGSFWVIDSFAIPKTTYKDDLIYAFLNYLYRSDVLGKYVKEYGFSPVIPLDFQYTNHLIYPALEESLLTRLHFYDDVIPESQLNEIWIDLKA